MIHNIFKADRTGIVRIQRLGVGVIAPLTVLENVAHVAVGHLRVTDPDGIADRRVHLPLTEDRDRDVIVGHLSHLERAHIVP